MKNGYFLIWNKLYNQNSQKLIGIQVLGKFWLHRTTILKIMGQILTILATKIYRKPQNSLQHSNVHNF